MPLAFAATTHLSPPAAYTVAVNSTEEDASTNPKPAKTDNGAKPGAESKGEERGQEYAETEEGREE
jgi:hypothetical protein